MGGESSGAWQEPVWAGSRRSASFLNPPGGGGLTPPSFRTKPPKGGGVPEDPKMEGLNTTLKGSLAGGHVGLGVR